MVRGGVIRDHPGASEDKFFPTVTLGSGLVFITLTIASTALAAGMFDSYRVDGLGSSLWMILIFPAWVLLVSVCILITNLRRKRL